MSNEQGRKITVNYGMTINRGNYESERIDLSYSYTLGKDEDPSDAIRYVHDRLKMEADELTGGFTGGKKR